MKAVDILLGQLKALNEQREQTIVAACELLDRAKHELKTEVLPEQDFEAFLEELTMFASEMEADGINLTMTIEGIPPAGYEDDE